MKKKKARVIWVGQDTNGRLSGLHYWYRRNVCASGLKPIKFIEAV